MTWNHDMSAAPKHLPIIAATADGGYVTKTKWVWLKSGETGYWPGFAQNGKNPPAVWMHWPTYEPNAVVQPMSVNTGAVEFMTACVGEGGC